ncbi:E3 ubiquitin-protein ligase TRIM39-like [Xiphophorus hellerii]|uniref:E3 ubiquitin-protein ligase TRIM39-like n=1 Tax=Xiphophorus hellerii TaxID=8084 RepID=UPI0013B3E5C8|nr:E3 ubiquitin-protein ligase TRIM39-like [Xiphophorus hellerii]XP_032445923.1 E3 ubiquitin-protein ligase TRIM39-like [Xiphophorus hellerii]XP_032445924.1 E3 ubiquitin-protein ligase TRIM39-like [Xiphophorus hellerii]
MLAAGGYQLSEEHLWCCICLDVFSSPVTLPCGHNFCRSCIQEHLTSDPQRRCPMCKERVDKKHKLGVNTFISELAVQYRQSAGRKSGSSSEPRKAPCGAPVRPKPLTSRSWLLLAATLLALLLLLTANLHLHQSLSSGETLLSEAESVCSEHQEPLELFCKNDQVSICRRCGATAHRLHQLVPLSDEYQEKKAELSKTEARIQQVIWQRRLKIQELKRSLQQSEEAADGEMADGVRIFSSLIQTLEAAQAELIGAIEEKRRAREKQSQSLMADLEQEVGKLRRRQVQLQQLSRSSDPLVFLQSFPALNAIPATRNWTQLRMCPLVYDGLTRTALLSATNQLTDTIRNAMQTLQDAAVENLHRSAVDVDLDPDTAHPALRLSDDRRRVQLGDGGKTLPYQSKRFEALVGVLGRRGFSCGRFHYDVQVKGKTAWTLGVARESVNRKVELDLSPENGFWTIRLQNRKEFVALASKPLPLSVGYNPDWVRVFVDYEEGQVSFYDVEAAVLLHSFTGFSFSEKLFPFFSPGPNDGDRNSAPLIITPPTQHAEK